MIVFVSISAVCTGILMSGIAGCLGLPVWIAALISGLTSAGMTFGLFHWARNEAKIRSIGPEKRAKQWQELALYKENILRSALDDLKKADIDCQFCAHRIDNAGTDFEKYLKMNTWNECMINCACKHCSGNSNWKWRGVCDDNDVEE